MALLFWAPLGAANQGREGHVTAALPVTGRPSHAWIRQDANTQCSMYSHPAILHNYPEHDGVLELL